MEIKKIVPKFIVSWYHFLLSFIGATVYGFPSSNVKVIAVTGTKGKSTVVAFITKILEEAGYKVASLSSINFKIGSREWTNKLKMTMPGPLMVQRLLKQAAEEGCRYVVFEVTSEGIKQHRHRFIKFDAAVFTNLAPEHIESHGSFENYRAAKGQLFRIAKNIHVINLDDKNAEYFLKFPAGKKYGFRIKEEGSKIEIEPSADIEIVEAEKVRAGGSGYSFVINGLPFDMSMAGKFNVYNSLAAVCVGLSQGIKLEICKKALENIKGVPGRMEIVAENPFKVVVDYAHTPDSLQEAYKAAGGLKTGNSRIICVLGSAGGGRDKWKRPELGKIASQYCDQIILTNEDPYEEDPVRIIGQIESGIKDRVSILKILDRREAIRKALILAKPDDVVMITGKGCEPWMCVEGGRKIPWDDRQIVREELSGIIK